jgi:hypothetical protein
MTKQEWQEHIDGCLPANIKRPSTLKDDKDNLERYRAWMKIHQPTCSQCAARKRTYNQVKNARMKRDVYKTLGLKRVVGALGGVYYE